MPSYDALVRHSSIVRWLFRLGLVPVVAFVLATAMGPRGGPMSGDSDWITLGPLQVTPLVLLVALAAAVALVTGLVWIGRITRGSDDEPPAWRYRDN